MFHVEHFPNFLFLMALDIVQYNSGDPITAGTTYQIPGEMNSEAWILQSTTQGAVFQMTATAPTDEDWSNIQDTQFHINGTVTGLILPILSDGYFRVVKEPVTEHATMALVEQEFQMEVADPINPFVAGTSVAPGYYDLSSLNLEAGKMYVLSVLPVQDKDYPETPGIVTDETFSAVIVGLTGTKATQVILRGVTTVGSHLFVMTGAKPILHLGGRSNVKFNITVSPVVFSAGSGGSLTPSSDATITGAWVFSNTISVPAPTARGHAANKEYVDAAIDAIPVFNPAEAQTILASWNFTNGLTRTTKASPVNTDIMNKQMSDVLYVPATGNTTIAGTKTFSDGITLGDEKLLTLGIGANAMKIHGSGTGAAVIEGANGTSLDVAVPTDFSEPVTFQDTVSHPAPGTSETIVSSWSGDKASYELRYRGTDGALRLTKGGGGESIFSCGSDGHMFSLYWFTASNFSVNGSSRLNAGVTMGQTLTVAGVTTLNNNLVLNPSNGGPTISASGGTVSWTQLGNTLAFQIQDTNAAILFSGSAPSASVDIQKPDAQILTATSLMNQGESDGRYLKLAGGTVAGATTFNAGVTMGQTLSVAGKASFGDGIESNKPIVLMDGVGVLSGSIEGYYGDPSNSGFSFIDSTSTVFFRLNYNNAAKRVEVSLPTADSSLVLPVMESVSVSGTCQAGTCQAEVFQFGPNSIRYNASTPTTVEVSGDWKFGITTFTGAAAFNAGVTMGQTLTVTGAINSNGLLNIADGAGIQFGTSIKMYSIGADFWLVGPANGKVGLNLPIEFPGPAEGTTLTDRMGVNVAMGDARYAKIVTTTKAAYTALATKDPTTIYLITDTTPRMWAIGDMGIVTADVPA